MLEVVVGAIFGFNCFVVVRWELFRSQLFVESSSCLDFRLLGAFLCSIHCRSVLFNRLLGATLFRSAIWSGSVWGAASCQFVTVVCSVVVRFVKATFGAPLLLGAVFGLRKCVAVKHIGLIVIVGSQEQILVAMCQHRSADLVVVVGAFGE